MCDEYLQKRKTSWVIMLINQFDERAMTCAVLRKGITEPPPYVVRRNRAWYLREQLGTPEMGLRAEYYVLGDEAHTLNLPKGTMRWEDWSND